MKLSMPITNGSSPWPAPDSHARPNVTSRTRLSWRKCPNVNAPKNVPSVEGAITLCAKTKPVLPAPQHVYGIDAVSAGEHPVHQRHHLALRQRRARHPAPKHADSFTRSSIPSRSANVAVNNNPAHSADSPLLPQGRGREVIGGSVLDVGEEKTDPARGRLGQSASQLACLR
jgi:hypothetical protein